MRRDYTVLCQRCRDELGTIYATGKDVREVKMNAFEIVTEMVPCECGSIEVRLRPLGEVMPTRGDLLN